MAIYTAIEDVLICAFGFKYLKTRENLRKLNPSIFFFEYVNPTHFDILVEAAKSAARYDSEKETFESPSFTINIRPTIIQCCEIADLYALKRKDFYGRIISANVEADLKTLIRLVKNQWYSELSSQAMNDLNMNKFTK